MLLPSNPQELGLKHSTWRPAQRDALIKVKTKHDNGGGFIVAELPTGTGKSAIGAALSFSDNVTVLVQTLGLLDQYESEYGFDIIKGRQEYKCALNKKIDKWAGKYNRMPTASDCHFEKMGDCPASGSCGYLIAKHKALASKRMACTYKYAVLSEAVRERSGIVILDEAHTAGEEILSLSEFKIVFNTVKKLNFDPPPYLKAHSHQVLSQFARDGLVDWCNEIVNRPVDAFMVDMMDVSTSEEKRFKRYVSDMLWILDSDSEVYFEYNDADVPNRFTGKMEHAHFIIKPLEARGVARKLWTNKTTILLMSATIGNPYPLTKELGISTFDNHVYGHPVPISARPVYDLGCNKMTYDMLQKIPKLPQIQGRMIYNFIQRLNPEWRGIVLAPSYKKVDFLRGYLYELMPDRVMIPPLNQFSVTDRISSFIEDDRKGLIAVDTIQGWGTGLDLRGDMARFAIIAGVPFDNPNDTYHKLRMEIEGKKQYSFWTAYNQVVQGCGRVSRGERDDNGAYETSVSALADGSCTTPMASGYMSKWFKEAIIRG